MRLLYIITLSSHPFSLYLSLSPSQFKHDPLPPAPPKPSQEQDAELDELLSDLTSFNPSAVVAETHPPPKPPSPVPQPRLSPPMRSGYSSTPSSAHSTPQHNHMMASQPTPTPPSTPGHMPPRSYTQVERQSSSGELRPRTHSETSPARSKDDCKSDLSSGFALTAQRTGVSVVPF